MNISAFASSARPRSVTFSSLAWQACDVEGLEARRLFATTLAPHPLTNDALPRTALRHVIVTDHKASWYKRAKTVTIKSGKHAAAPQSIKVNGLISPAATTSAASVSFSTNAAGLPLLTSRTDGKGLKIFLDFDGYNTDVPFDLDGNPSTFNTAEQTDIYNTWRDIVSYFSMLDVNVTTVQPPTGGNNPNFVWHRITGSVTNGAAYVGSINNSTSNGWTEDYFAVSRTSGIAHEIGHQLNLQHQSDYSNDGTKLNEYSSGYSDHGPIMGVDYAQSVHKWTYGRNANSPDTIQDDLPTMAAYLKQNYPASVDGYMPDDYTGTTFATATPLTLSGGTYAATGAIERLNDSDIFSFASTGGTYDLNVEPVFTSPLAPKLDLYDSSGNLIAEKDDTAYRNTPDNTGEEFSLSLPAGTYYAKVSSHGDYSDQGDYAFYASPLPAGWTSTDVNVGATGRGGYVSYNSAVNGGTFSEGGSGADITGTSDSFHYTYQVLNGDGSITARVASLDNTDPYAKAGVMLRETLAANARHASMYFTPSGSEFSHRDTVGGNTTIGYPGGSMPGWVRLVRSGTTITYYTSTDGTNFTQVGTATLSGLATQVYVGLAVTSKNTQKIATGTFDHVALSGTLGVTTTTNGLAAPANLTAAPAAAQSTNVQLSWSDVAGETGFAIERSVDGVNWTQTATTGANVTTYTAATGFGSMRFWWRVAALSGTTKGAYSNVASAVNKPSAPTSAQAINVGTGELSLSWRDVSGDAGYRVDRSTDGGQTYATIGTTAANARVFNATGLAAGVTYTFRVTPLSAAGDGVPLTFGAPTLPAAVTTLAFTAKALGGVGLTWSGVTGATGYSVERSTDNATWAAVGTTAAGVTTFTDTAATSPLTHYYYRVFATNARGQSAVGNVIFFATPAATANPSPWTDADLGPVAGSGAGSVSGTTATVLGSGNTQIVGTADGLNFLSRTLTGDGQIVARVTGLEGINGFTKAGLMMRDGTAAGAKNVAVYYQTPTKSGSSVQGGYGTDAGYRATANAAGVVIDGPSDSAYAWLKITRAGSLFTTYASTDGVTWTQINAVTIAMGQTLSVGLLASSRSDTAETSATFDNIAVTPATLPTATGMVVNGGAVQRSRVTSLAVTFNTPVTLADGAITLWRRDPAGGAPTQITGFALTPSAGNTVYTLTFPGDGFVGGSLADGRYDLRVGSAGVTNADGFAMAADASFSTFRLFADGNGDAAVTISDFNDLAAAFNTRVGDPQFNATYDSNGDGAITIADFNELAARFNQSI